PIQEQIPGAATAGARGLVVDAAGDLGPDRLSETGRRELRQMLRSVELDLVALSLPTRRPFDSLEQLEDRLERAERAFAMAFDLGTKLVLARVGGLPPEGDGPRGEAFPTALRGLGREADHRGARFATETGPQPGGVPGP